MSLRLKNTVEVISSFETSADLWDEIYDEYHLNEHVLQIYPDHGVKLRCLGPFIKGYRFYMPRVPLLDKIVTRENWIAILNQDSSVYRDTVDAVINYDEQVLGKRRSNHSLRIVTPRETQIQSAIKTLEETFERGKWQKCVFVNVFIKEISGKGTRIKIWPLIPVICDRIFDEVDKLKIPVKKFKMCGLNAHDIRVGKNGRGLETKYTLKVDKKPTLLSTPEIEYIFKTGLLDIPEVLNKIVTKGVTSYIYHVPEESQYKMSDEFCYCLYNEYRQIGVNMHMELADKNLGDLPSDAFENRASLNPIRNLEL